MSDRGVRLGDLDRGKHYELAYVIERKRWEVIGECAPSGVRLRLNDDQRWSSAQ